MDYAPTSSKHPAVVYYDMIWYSIKDDIVDMRADIQYLSVLEAAEVTVKYIMINYPPPYHLMVSGGIDSQAMMYIWKLFGKNFIPTAVRYNTDLNKHDLETLPEFSTTHNLDIQYLDFDILKFYETQYDALAHRYECVSPHFGAHLGMTEQLPGTVIFSGDFIQHTNNVRQRSTIWPGNRCLYTAAQSRNIVPYFFLHTPEIAYSYLYEALSRDLFQERAPGGPDQYWEKAHHYKKFGMPVIMQRTKYTGFERIKDYYDVQYKNLVTSKTRIKYRLKHSNRVYDLLLRYPYEKKFGNPIFEFKFNTVVPNPARFHTTGES